MGDWGLCPEPLAPLPSLLWAWGCWPGLSQAFCGAGCLWAGQAGEAGAGGSPLPGAPLRMGAGTQLRELYHQLFSLLPSPAPRSLSSPGAVTLFLQVLCGLESRAQGDPLKWGFLPPVASPTTLPPTHPQIRKGRSETQLIDKKLPQPSSGHAGHKSLFSRSRIKGRSRTASQGLWGKLRGPQGRNLSLTSHSATFSLLFSHTHTKLLPSRQCF